MSKQVQDAYIVAATRTPIGRSGARLLPQHAARRPARRRDPRARWRRCRALDPKAIEDAIVGCAIPEGEQGMNMARIAVAAGRLAAAGRRRHGQPLLRLGADRGADGGRPHPRRRGRRDDRRRRRVMSLVPMGGNKPSFNPAIFARDENVGIAYGMGLTAEKVAAQWKVSREAQDAFALAVAPEGAEGACGRRVRRRDRRRSRSSTASRTSPTGEQSTRRRAPSSSTKARAPTPRSKAWPSCAGVRGDRKGSVTAGNSSQTSDGAGALILASEKAVKQFDLKPLARFVSFAARGVPPEIMGIGPIEAIPAALRYAGLTLDDIGWIELNEAFAAQALAVIDTRRARPGEGQPDGRRDRARPPARRDRRDPRGDRRARAAPPQPEVRHGDDVRRHRAGRGRHLRARLSATTAQEPMSIKTATSTASRPSRSPAPRRRTRSPGDVPGDGRRADAAREPTTPCAPCCITGQPGIFTGQRHRGLHAAPAGEARAWIRRCSVHAGADRLRQAGGRRGHRRGDRHRHDDAAALRLRLRLRRSAPGDAVREPRPGARVRARACSCRS